MGNSDLQQFPKEGLKSRNPPSPKLLVSGNMSQSKVSTGSPKSPKSPDGNSKSDGVSLTNSSNSGRSPSSIKSSPGSTKSLSVAERLALATSRGKSSPTPRSPGSKSPPTSPNPLTSSKTDKIKESTDQCLKSEEIEKNINTEVSIEIPCENTLCVNEKQSVIIENGTNESCEVKPHNVDESVVSNLIEKIESSEENDSNEVKENGIIESNSKEVIINEEAEIKEVPLRINDNVILELTSKKDIRQKVWAFLEEHSLVVFPKPCFNRIPNFKGCINASQSLEKLDEFKKAKTVQVTPDKAQETARFLTLSWGKRLLVPLLRLKEGLLQIVSLPFAEPSSKMLRSASTQKGLRKWGNKLITLDQNDGHHIDMIILGSVAVDKKGHRIGIGNGFCDLEFVILSTMNMVTDKTVVVTIVHDAQVFDNLPTNVFKPFDVPVDIIITPNEIIRVENRLDRPKNVFWNYISKRRLLEMPPLQLLRTKQEKDSNLDCTLKEVDSEPEEIPPSPKTYRKSKGFRQRRTYSTRSDTNDSVFKDTEVSKPSKQSSAPVSKNSKSKAKNKRAKSTSSQKHHSRSVDRHNSQDEQKEIRTSSKKPNKRRTKSESAKTIVSPVAEPKISNGAQVESSSSDSPKNKRRSRQKPRQRIHSDDIDKQSIYQSNNTKFNGNNKPKSRSNSRSTSRVTRRDYFDRQDFSREASSGRNPHREYIPSPKKYYSQNRHNSYSQERLPYGSVRSNSQMQRRDSNRSMNMQQNRYSNGPGFRQTRYFNGGAAQRHNNYSGQISSHQINTTGNHQIIRHNSYSNDSLSHQNGFYDGVVTRRNSYCQGSTNRQDGYTNSRIFRPPQYRNGMASQIDERDYVRNSRPLYNNNHPGYYNSNEKPKSSRSVSSDEFVLKVGNIANNVRVRDLKAALLERGVKPMHITWRGPRGFAYLRYNNSIDVNKDNVIGSLQNVRIKPNGVETAQTQTLIVTECQFS